MSGFFTSEGNVRPRSSRGRSENSGGGKSSFDFFSWNDNKSGAATAAKVGCSYVCVCVMLLFGVPGYLVVSLRVVSHVVVLPVV